MEHNDIFPLISSILAGAACGIFMAAVLLFLFSVFGYTNRTSIALIAVVAICLPFLFDFLARRGLSVVIVEFLMAAISMVFCLIYAYTAAMNDTALTAMRNSAVLVHVLSLLGMVIRLMIMKGADRR